MPEQPIEEIEEGLGRLAQNNLADFREIVQRERTLTEETLWVHVVHGTWANPEKAKFRPAWSEPGGSLETALRSHGESELWNKVRFAKVPPWSGRNSFAARSKAIEDLERYLRGVLLDREKTFGRHLIIAHSHGGTVAAEALRNLGPLAREFAGFVTLGTPFVQRVRADQGRFDSLTAIFAPAVALFFCLSLGITCALENFYWLAGLWAVFGFIPGALCGIPRVSGFGWALCSITPLLALAFFRLTLGWQDLGGLLESSLLAAIATLFIGMKLTPDHTVKFLSATDADSEEDLPRPIEVPVFLAIRAPGDEASLAISAASGAVFASDTIRQIGSKLAGLPEKWWTGLAWGIFAVVILVLSSIFWQDAWPATAKYVRLAGYVACVGLYMVTAFALMLILAVKSAAVTLMAIACGWEAFEAPGIIRIYAEPLPRSRESLERPMTLRMTFPTAGDLEVMKKSSGLRHSIYDYPSVQEFLAGWILDFTRSKAS